MRFSILVCLCLSTLFAPAPGAAAPNIVYLSRHAEKVAQPNDPPLSEQGQVRARNLATLLSRAGIVSIYSSATTRTRQTAAALADALGLTVRLYDAADPSTMIVQVRTQTGPSLLIGHSNTLPDLVRRLGGEPGADIGDDEYDRLYQIITEPDGTVTTVMLSTSAK